MNPISYTPGQAGAAWTIDMQQWNKECDAALAALTQVGIDREQTKTLVAALHVANPEAKATDIVMMVLELRKHDLPKELAKASFKVGYGFSAGQAVGAVQSFFLWLLIAVVVLGVLFAFFAH